MQERYHQQLFAVLIPTLEDPEPRYVCLGSLCHRLIFLQRPFTRCCRTHQFL